MTPNARPKENPEDKPPEAPDQTLTQQQLEELSDPKKQAEYWKAFIAQERRRACPGCGDDSLF